MALPSQAISFNWNNSDYAGGLIPSTASVGHYNFGSFLQLSAKDANGVDVAQWADAVAQVVDTDDAVAHPISQYYTPNKADNISIVNPDGSRAQPQSGYTGKTVRITMKNGSSPSSATLGQWDVSHVNGLGAPVPAVDTTQLADLNSMAFINYRNLWAYNAVTSGKILPSYFSTYHIYVYNNVPPAGCSKVVFDNAISKLKSSIKAWYVAAKYSGNLYVLSLTIDTTAPVYVTINDRNVAAYNNYRNYWGAKALECGQFTLEVLATYYTTVVNDVPPIGVTEAVFNTKITALKESIKTWFLISGFSNAGNGIEKLRQLIEFTTPSYLYSNQEYLYDPNVDAFTNLKYIVLNYIMGRINGMQMGTNGIFNNNTGHSSIDPNPLGTYNTILLMPPPPVGVSEPAFNLAITRLVNAIKDWFKSIVFWRMNDTAKNTEYSNSYSEVLILPPTHPNATGGIPWVNPLEDTVKYAKDDATGNNTSVRTYYAVYNTGSSHHIYSLDWQSYNTFISSFLQPIIPVYIQPGASRFSDPLSPSVTVNTLGAKVGSGRKTVIPRNIIFKFNQMRKYFALEASTYVSGWTGLYDTTGAKVYGSLIENTGLSRFPERITKFNNAINGTTSDSDLQNTDFYQASIELSNGAAKTIVAPSTSIPINTPVYIYASIPYDTTLTKSANTAHTVTLYYPTNYSPYTYRIAVYSKIGALLGYAATASPIITPTITSVTITGFKSGITTTTALSANTEYYFSIIPLTSQGPIYNISSLPFNSVLVKTNSLLASGGTIEEPIVTDDVTETPGTEQSMDDIAFIAPTSTILGNTSTPSSVLTQVGNITNKDVVAETSSLSSSMVGSLDNINRAISSGIGPRVYQGHGISSATLANPSNNLDKVHITLSQTPTTIDQYSNIILSIKKYRANNSPIYSDIGNTATFDTVSVTFKHIADFVLKHTSDDGIDTTVNIPLSSSTTLPYQVPLQFTGSTITITSLDTVNDTFEATIFAPFSTYTQIPSGIPSNPPCLPTGTKVLTPFGYRNVETIKNGDYVVNSNGKNVPVQVYSRYIPATTAETAPYLIPAGTFNSQPKPIRLSPMHAIKTGRFLWDIPRYAAERYPSIKQYGIGEQITYYHLETPDFFNDNLVIDGGAVVESYAANQWNCKKPIYEYNRRSGGFTRTATQSSKRR